MLLFLTEAKENENSVQTCVCSCVTIVSIAMIRSATSSSRSREQRKMKKWPWQYRKGRKRFWDKVNSHRLFSMSFPTRLLIVTRIDDWSIEQAIEETNEYTQANEKQQTLLHSLSFSSFFFIDRSQKNKIYCYLTLSKAGGNI